MKKLYLLLFIVIFFSMINLVSAVIISESPTGVTIDSNTSDTGSFGYKITMGATYSFHLISVNKHPYEGATTARLRYGSNTTDIATATFVGDVANFSSGVYLNATQVYQIVTDSGGASRNLAYDASMGGYPIAGTNLTWTDRVGLGATQAGGINSIEYSLSVTAPFSGPTIVLDSPGNNTILSTTGSNFTINSTAGSYNLTNVTYQVLFANGSNFNETTISISGDGLNQSILFIDDFILENYIWRGIVCQGDGAGTNCTTSDYYNFTIGATLNSQTYTAFVYETQYENFTANISLLTGATLYAQNFWFNGTSYVGNNAETTTDNYTIWATFDIPLINLSTTNLSGMWQITFQRDDGTFFFQNLTSFQQNVNEWELEVLSGNFSYSGNYNYIIQCNSSASELGGISNVGLMVSPTGREAPSTGEGVVYFSSIAVMFFFSLLLFLISNTFKVERESHKDDKGQEKIMERGNAGLRFGFIGASFVIMIITFLYVQIALEDLFVGFTRTAGSYQTFLYVGLLFLVIIFIFVLISLIISAVETWRTKHGKNPKEGY